MPSSLNALLRPRSVAVIGASRKRKTIAAEVFANLLHSGFTGAVYPVNPASPVVQSVKAWPSVEDIPDPVDLAVIVVPAAQVLDAVEACGRKGVRGIVVITAGFAETGSAGRRRQEAVLERLRHWGMRMVGPNCLGLLNTDPAVGLNATFAPTFPPAGDVAVASQSGALGLAILDHAQRLGVGISQFVSIGNKADVDAADLLAFWEQDAATRVILLYVESLGDPGRFLGLARRVARRKPIAVVKSGRTAAGARAASSHTGSLAGADVAVDALLGQAGVLRVDGIDELFDVAMLLSTQPVPGGPRVAILTNAGGPGIMATDACESRGLEVVRLRPETEAALQAFLPPEASVRNPVDMIASASAQSYARALRLLLDDPEVDAVLLIFVTPIVTDPQDVAAAILAAAEGSDKPLATCLMGTHGVAEASSSLRRHRFPSFAFPEAAVRALAHAVRYGAFLQSPEGSTPALEGFSEGCVSALLGRAPPGWLPPETVEGVLAACGVLTPLQGTATDAAGAAEIAADILARIGAPGGGADLPGARLVVKLIAGTIQHKSDVGGVILGVRTPEAAAAAFDAIRARLAALGREGEMEGALLQEQVASPTELFAGATRDPAFGPLIGFGIGGVNVELWKDIAFRVAPLRDTDARQMPDQLRARALLDGFRGAPPVDRAQIADLLLRLSHLVDTFPRIAELDLNPVLPTARGLVAVDARIRLG